MLEDNAHYDGEDLGDEEEEVFGLGLDTDSDGSTEEELSDDNEKKIEKTEPSSSKTKKGKVNKRAPSTSPSESESEEETWGRKKSAYYASNSEFLSRNEGEENEDELNEMEEQEARKIQARMKNLQLEEDYGLNDIQDSLPELSEELDITSALPVGVPAEPMDNAAALRYLERTSPETLALSREWSDVLEDLRHVEEQLQSGVTSSSRNDTINNGLKHLYHQTLMSYITVLAFYIHLQAGQSAINQPSNIPNARTKAVLGRLLTLKQALATIGELDFLASNQEELSDLSDDSEEEFILNTSDGKKTAISMDELLALLQEADEIVGSKPTGGRRKRAISNGTGKGGLVADKPKKKKDKLSQHKDVAFDLVEPSFKPSRSSKRPARDSNTSDVHGEVTELLAADSMDKKARRRTLRFHTHKIETSARKREQYREKLGGDDDIPYSERKKEKEMRIQKEVLKSRGTGGDDLEAGSDDNGDSVAETNTAKRKRDEPSDSEGEDGYYELVKRAKKDSKEEKKREYEQTRLAEKFYDEDDGAEEGPRSLTRAILKNRGLTPRRSKSVRNPRVKKRERYQKAQKKVRSQKAVYKGGMGSKPYSGEESGISKVVKSVRLA